MSDSDIAIAVHDVSRMFKRYRHPRYRVLEAFGLPLPKNAYDEFWALRGISLELRRGDSLAVIGQNGAGKSTLLNIICGGLQPTSGTVAVRGNIQALMDLGTGFHPEFTGRQNVYSALAYQGVTGSDANQRFDEIVDFSELAEFIDQPIKTYSSGMYARLAFSTASAIVPDVLIIDEILGAGDAYFAAKCADRMRRLTKEVGATVLFVSHDMSSVQRLCEKAVWLERGRVRMTGATLDLSKAYYASVVEREEARLRAQTTRAVSRMRRRDRTSNGSSEDELLLFRLLTADGRPPALTHAVYRIALVLADGRRLEVLPGEAMDNDNSQTAYVATDPGYMLWSLPVVVNGRTARCVESTGGIYRHAPIYFRASADLMGGKGAIEIEHRAAAGELIAVELHEPSGYRRLGILTPPEDPNSCRVESFAISPKDETASVAKAAGSRSMNSSAEPPAQVDRFRLETGLDDECATASAQAGPGGENAELTVEPRDLAAPQDRAAPQHERTRSEALAGDPGRAREKWETAEARFLDVAVCNGAAAPQHVFDLGEAIAFKITAELSVPVPVCWLAVILYDDRGNRVLLAVHHFQEGLQRGIYEVLFRIDRPNLRQSNYVATIELLPELNLDWHSGARLPYLCHWDRSIYFRIDEDYHGSIELGMVSLPVTVIARRLQQHEEEVGARCFTPASP